MTNTNCLENIQCPACAHEESFRIAGKTIFTVTDDGTEDYGHVDWDDESYIECTACHRYGSVKEFTVRNRLDADAAKDVATMAAEHTPGPWDDNDNGIILGNLDNYKGEAPVVAVVSGYDDDGNASAEAKANARLIKACPALLQLLKRATGNWKSPHEYAAWKENARAIIAEATAA